MQCSIAALVRIDSSINFGGKFFSNLSETLFNAFEVDGICEQICIDIPSKFETFSTISGGVGLNPTESGEANGD